RKARGLHRQPGTARSRRSWLRAFARSLRSWGRSVQFNEHAIPIFLFTLPRYFRQLGVHKVACCLSAWKRLKQEAGAVSERPGSPCIAHVPPLATRLAGRRFWRGRRSRPFSTRRRPPCPCLRVGPP